MLRTSNSSSSYYKFSGLLAVALLGIATIIGSGGGGGGGGPAPDTSTPIVYSGVTTIATITPTNASKLTSDVTGGADAANIIGGGLSGVAIERNDATRDHGSGAIDIALRLSRSFRKAAAHAKRVSSAESTVSAVIPVDETEACDSNQGTLRISGTLSDSGTGTVSVTFSSCLSDGVTVNGSATMRIDAFDLVLLVPTDLTLSFARLTFRAPDLSVDVGGSMRVETNVGLDTETITANLVFLDNSTGETGKTENLVIVKVTTSPTSYTVSISGRVYDHVHGYVDITTPITLVYSTLTQVYPDSGEILLTGDLNGSIRVTALSSTLVMLALDLDGDGTPENTATLEWAELLEETGSDLGDDDGDGMHNSWETANGLLPSVDDATDDKDGDGASNIEEYLAGTDPNDPASAPVDLSISITDSPDPVTVGFNVTYTITVSNLSSLAASDVVVTDSLPGSVSLVSATTSQGSCTGTTSLSCDLGTLNGSGSVFVTIVVTTTAEGVINNTASVVSSTGDPDLTNNSATATTSIQTFTGQVVNLSSNSDLIFDSVTQRIYAAVLGDPGTIVPLDPTTGNTETAIPVGIDPVKLARSDNGQYLYVGLDGQPSAQRIDVSGQAVDLTFLLGDDPNFGPYFVEDMEVLPGIPNSVSISRRRKGVSPRHGGVAIYDDGVQRATTTPDHTGSNVIEFSASAATLYGYNNESTEFGFRRMAVDASGVTVTDVFTSFMGDLISGFGVDILFHGGSIYTTSGREIDPVARTVLGTFPLPATFGNLVEVDAAVGRVFFLTSSGGHMIRAFDMTTRQEVGSVAIPGVNGSPTRLIRWGAKGLAFGTSDGQIFLVESSQLIP